MTEVETKSRGSAKPVIIGVGVAVIATVLACTVFLAVYMSRVEDKLEWASYNGHYGDSPVTMNGELEVDAGRRLIVDVNAGGREAGINSSVTLLDYNVGLKATRLVGAEKVCFIEDVEDTFEEALEKLASYKETGDIGPRPVTRRRRGDLIPQEEHVSVIGQDLANFCRGSSTHRLQDDTALSREKRQVIIIIIICCECGCKDIEK